MTKLIIMFFVLFLLCHFYKATLNHASFVKHNRWTNFNYTTNIRGDITFYGDSWTSSATGTTGYLGALMHNVPGYLAEGYFHSYHPARHRAMNFDVDRWNGAYIYK